MKASSIGPCSPVVFCRRAQVGRRPTSAAGPPPSVPSRRLQVRRAGVPDGLRYGRAFDLLAVDAAPPCGPARRRGGTARRRHADVGRLDREAVSPVFSASTRARS